MASPFKGTHALTLKYPQKRGDGKGNGGGGTVGELVHSNGDAIF